MSKDTQRDKTVEQLVKEYGDGLTIKGAHYVTDKEFIAALTAREERLITDAVFSELCTAYTQVVGHTLNDNPKMSKSKFVSRFTKYLNEYGAKRR